MTATQVAAFDTAAAEYDAAFSDTELGRRLRSAVWMWLDRAFGPGDHVLELGCGTGVDALHLARRGVRVLATDASQAMLGITRGRVVLQDANDLVRTTCFDLREIGVGAWVEHVGEGTFDGAFADFGVLNAASDRTTLLRGLAGVVRPRGRIILVVMGPVAAWEIAWHVLHGEPRHATRRWRSGSRARVGRDGRIRVWYPSASRLAAEASPWFRVVGRAGMGVALPPSGLSVAMERRGALLRALAPLERHFGETRIGVRLGDHYLLDLERRAD